MKLQPFYYYYYSESVFLQILWIILCNLGFFRPHLYLKFTLISRRYHYRNAAWMHSLILEKRRILNTVKKTYCSSFKCCTYNRFHLEKWCFSTEIYLKKSVSDLIYTLFWKNVWFIQWLFMQNTAKTYNFTLQNSFYIHKRRRNVEGSVLLFCLSPLVLSA